jgi:hypothetical protein
MKDLDQRLLSMRAVSDRSSEYRQLRDSFAKVATVHSAPHHSFFQPLPPFPHSFSPTLFPPLSFIHSLPSTPLTALRRSLFTPLPLFTLPLRTQLRPHILPSSTKVTQLDTRSIPLTLSLSCFSLKLLPSSFETSISLHSQDSPSTTNSTPTQCHSFRLITPSTPYHSSLHRQMSLQRHNPLLRCPTLLLQSLLLQSDRSVSQRTTRSSAHYAVGPRSAPTPQLLIHIVAHLFALKGTALALRFLASR